MKIYVVVGQYRSEDRPTTFVAYHKQGDAERAADLELMATQKELVENGEDPSEANFWVEAIELN